jgi:uncharacterized protein YndB with AHSA1/START domain
MENWHTKGPACNRCEKLFILENPKTITMKVIKWILIVLTGIVVLLAITGLFVKKEYHVDRAITIARSRTDVFNYIRYLKNQDHFSKWNMMDPNMTKYYKGTDGTPGFVAGWDSQLKDLGHGEQEIKRIAEGERIDFELRFIEPMASTNQAYFITTAADSSHTNVIWAFDGKMNYPMNLLLLFINMDKVLGGDLQTGLNNLKKELEK